MNNQRREAGQSGVALLTVVVLMVVVVLGALVVNLYLRHQQLRADDTLRTEHLTSLARAQEFYFNRYHRYGTLTELLQASLLPAMLTDPDTHQPYPVYLSSLYDEWCAWAKLATTPDTYLVQTATQSFRTSQLPVSLASCKSP